MQPSVVIFRDQILPYSETFIPAQVNHFRRYQGFYVGTTTLSDDCFPLPDDRKIVLDQCTKRHKLWKNLYMRLGIVHPRWLSQIKSLAPRLIHAHLGIDGVLAMPLAKQLKIPLVVTFHGYYATAEVDLAYGIPAQLTGLTALIHRDRFYPTLFYRQRSRLFRTADQIIAVSQFIRDRLIKRGCPPEKIQVHYIGVDLKQLTPDLRVVRQPTVLFVGRLIEKKGCEYLIRAMAEVQIERPDCELVLIGEGTQRSALEALAANSLKSYRFLGVQSPEKVRSWMNQAAVLAAPSVTGKQGNSEGLPMVILEAQAMGLPVVSSWHAGIPEAVEHEKSGFLTLERDTQAIAAYLLTLLENEELRKTMAIQGRKKVECQFDVCKNTKTLEALYDHLNHKKGWQLSSLFSLSKSSENLTQSPHTYGGHRPP
ncbi:MAG: glycosyltransferase [Leptolyngbyaceae cyanobacterium SM1_1_3]|nr:glycosyltransferase [Leptolyngbyaceae cyanobacterium SM1_1_3]